MTALTTRLYDAWRQAVVAGEVINQFEAAQDDLSGQWVKGDRITYGIKLIAGQFTHYACNLTQNEDIEGATEQKQVGDTGYLCRLNSYRALRPGASNRPLGRQQDLPAEASLCRFRCQDNDHPLSLLHREPLLTVPITHFTWKAYYNIAPIEASGHFLWIPTTAEGEMPHLLQQLTPAIIEDALGLFAQLSDTILFFNGPHAGASVNHIHLQAVRHWRSLPIESAPTFNYKGYQLLANYPAQAAVFDPQQQRAELTDYILKLHQLAVPFNLVMLENKVLVIAREGDQAVVSEFPGDVLGSLEMCGAITAVDRSVFDTVTPARIKTAFQKTVVPASEVIDRFG